MRTSNVFLTILASLVPSIAFAQSDLKGLQQPITAPIRSAGVYHVASGSWSRSASLANLTGPDTIYDNTCAAVYYLPLSNTESYQHRSRIPSPSGPTRASVFYGFFRHDEAPGCRDSYTVNGFQVAYCTRATSAITWSWDFASSYSSCAGTDMVSQYNVTVSGLPGGSVQAARCWIVDVDLSGTAGGGMVLSADGDGSYVGPSSVEQFGFSLTHDQLYSTQTGPLVAGDYVFTGGPVTGPLTPCTGTDGTIWDNPIDPTEEGTGMSSANFFRVAATPGPVSVGHGPGCYGFGNPPHADFWLELYADPQCSPPPVLTEYCFPGEAGTRACTACSPANPPSAHGRGCDNFGQNTGGAHLAATGIASVSNDTIVFASQFENDTAFTVIMQGTTTTNAVFGAGIRCVAGVLKRLYVGPAGSAANGDPPGTIHRPGPADARSVHQASLDVGYDIGSLVPVSLSYSAYYRDPSASASCGGATFNSSQSGYLNWVP